MQWVQLGSSYLNSPASIPAGSLQDISIRGASAILSSGKGRLTTVSLSSGPSWLKLSDAEKKVLLRLLAANAPVSVHEFLSLSLSLSILRGSCLSPPQRLCISSPDFTEDNMRSLLEALRPQTHLSCLDLSGCAKLTDSIFRELVRSPPP